MMEPVRTVVIGGPAAVSAIALSILDVLAFVGRDWEVFHGIEPSCLRFEGSLRTPDGLPYRDFNGRLVTPDGRLDEVPPPGLVIVPALSLNRSGALPTGLSDVTNWLAACHARGATVASVCSGALLLAASGLLDGCEATTHWAFADALAERFPAVKVRRERILVLAGEGHRVVTAGGMTAWTDLVLYLAGRFAGEVAARRVAKVWLLDPHLNGQMTYASLAVGRQHKDRLVAESQAWLAENYDRAAPVSVTAARFGLTERSFLRRFKRATGLTPAE